MSVFAVAARRRVGDAAGNRHRRDVAVKIRLIDDLDCYLTVSQRGIISTWTNKVVNRSNQSINQSINQCLPPIFFLFCSSDKAFNSLVFQEIYMEIISIYFTLYLILLTLLLIRYLVLM